MESAVIKLILRILVSGVLLVAIVSTLNIKEILAVSAKADMLWLLMALMITLLIRVMTAVRWQVILTTYRLPVSLRELIPIIFVSNTLGHLLPGGVGADIIRGHQVSKKYQHQQVAEVSATIILDRIIGFFSMFLLALLGAVIAWFLGLSNQLIIPLVLLNIASIFGFIAVNFLHGRVARIAPKKGKLADIWRKLSRLVRASTNISMIRQILWRIFVISMVVQLLRCLNFWMIYQSLGASVPAIYFLIFIPLVFVVMLLPISIGGFGVREGALLYFFSTVGIDSEISVAAGFLFYVLQLLAFFPGLIFLLFPAAAGTQELQREQ
jgi:uncharacterized protein (TIRG00374 family)